MFSLKGWENVLFELRRAKVNPFRVNPFTSKSDQISNFPLQPHQKYNITQYKELGFSSLTQMEGPILTTSLIHLPLKGWENVHFELLDIRLQTCCYCSNQWHQYQLHWVIPRPDNQRHAQGLINDLTSVHLVDEAFFHCLGCHPVGQFSQSYRWIWDRKEWVTCWTDMVEPDACRLVGYPLVSPTSVSTDSDCCTVHTKSLVSFPRMPFLETTVKPHYV